MLLDPVCGSAPRGDTVRSSGATEGLLADQDRFDDLAQSIAGMSPRCSGGNGGADGGMAALLVAVGFGSAAALDRGNGPGTGAELRERHRGAEG